MFNVVEAGWRVRWGDPQRVLWQVSHPSIFPPSPSGRPRRAVLTLTRLSSAHCKWLYLIPSQWTIIQITINVYRKFYFNRKEHSTGSLLLLGYNSDNLKYPPWWRSLLVVKLTEVSSFDGDKVPHKICEENQFYPGHHFVSPLVWKISTWKVSRETRTSCHVYIAPRKLL